MYHVLNHLDAPRRYFALTIDEVSVAGVGLMLMVVSSHKIVVVVLGALILMALRSIKQGRGPRFLWVLSYWHLPYFITRWMLSKLPASHCRVWRV